MDTERPSRDVDALGGGRTERHVVARPRTPGCPAIPDASGRGYPRVIRTLTEALPIGHSGALRRSALRLGQGLIWLMSAGLAGKELLDERRHVDERLRVGREQSDEDVADEARGDLLVPVNG